MKSSRHQLARVIAGMTVAGQLTSAQARALAAYVLTAKQTDQLAPLMRDVTALWTAQGRLEVQVVSARKLSATVLRDIRLKAKQLYPDVKHITIAVSYEPNMIGGARITIGDYQLDLSVHDRLARFKSLALQEEA